MEHITILTKEAITKGLFWPPVVVASIGICFVIAAVIVLIVGEVKRCYVFDHCVNLLIHAIVIIPVLFCTMVVCTIFFPQETGRYKYTGTIDDEMSAVEFAEFYATYEDIKFIDGVWIWEDKE